MNNILTQRISTILRVIYKKLPRHIKRLVLWSVLYSKLCGPKKLTKEEVLKMAERLNAVLPVARNTAACALPMTYGRVGLKSLDECAAIVQKTIKSGKSGETNLADFVKSIPEWMRYASTPLMQKDFQVVVATHTVAA